MAASSEDISLNIGIISNDLEEDLEEESINIINGEYDSVGAGGSDNNEVLQANQSHKKLIPFSPPLEFRTDLFLSKALLYKQYQRSLDKSLIISPFYILYCCAKDALDS